MLWNGSISYFEDPFSLESHLENAVCEAAPILFGSERIYLNLKKKIGQKGKIQNIPDGYLIDLASGKDPKLFVVEIELAIHEPLKHIASQVLEFSISFETTPQKIKSILKEALTKDQAALKKVESYIKKYNHDNIDALLEGMIYGKDAYNALVIIDDLEDELEKVLISRFKFPVETLTFKRFRNIKGDHIFEFVPFLSDLTHPPSMLEAGESAIDVSDIDTIVVPAREEGFNDVFMADDKWYAIRIHSSMIDKIKYIAAYRIAPNSAITHYAEVSSIEQWEDTAKYVVNFKAKANSIKPIPLIQKGKVKAPQAPRYTNLQKLLTAKNLDEVF